MSSTPTEPSGGSVDNQRGNRASIIQIVFVVAAAGAAFAGAMLFGSTSVHVPKGSEAKAHATLKLGDYKFSYPKSWQRMTDASDFAAVPKAGAVKTGLCAASVAVATCAPDQHVSYMLFEQPGKMAPLPQVVKGLRKALPHQLPGFGKLSVSSLTTQSGIPYTVLNFEYRKGKELRQESVAIYRDAEGNGAVVVATGPKTEFASKRDKMDSIFASARLNEA